MLRSDPPSEVFYPIPGAIIKGEQFLVCRRNGSQEIVVQSERSDSRAEQSVEVLNEHEIINAREPLYYWRIRKDHE